MSDFRCTQSDKINNKVIAERVKYFKEDERGVVSMSRIMEELEIKALAEGRAEGKAEGRAEGKAEGRAEGRAEGLVTTCLDLGLTIEATVKRLMDKLSYSEEDAKAFVARYA